ncbi:MAG: RlmE family RNA methyltransferase [Sutterellaceae bacterium]|nr:RlmE family RNA methyltransferase [Burkholderiaceae bacterium]MCX7901295.1 RlmE family RNA methyltransferase [Burkholderiaceae bacterium]MDW8430442.1 RlmE family RNA methyltransferase [Sutterellaceae bacterium]
MAASKQRSKRAWIERHLADPYVKAAAQRGYRSRAAFKLAQIDARDRLLRPGMVVVELGAAPGSWTQVVLERLRGRDGVLRGRIVALDLLPMEPLPGVDCIVGDFREPAVRAQLEAALAGAKVDLVLSDMAPRLSGIAAVDAARSCDLAEHTIAFALEHLQGNGALLLKAFHGSGFSQLVETLKRYFVNVATRKPAASRAESAETYLLARGLKKRVLMGAPNPSPRWG